MESRIRSRRLARRDQDTPMLDKSGGNPSIADFSGLARARNFCFMVLFASSWSFGDHALRHHS